MCGILAVFNRIQNTDYETNFEKGKRRGPNDSSMTYYDNNMIYGFHRLSINGLDKNSNQPLMKDGISLICNGEIYNYKELYDSLNIKNSTNSDCEIIIHLYQKFGMVETLKMIDGVFAFVLYDFNNHQGFIARDPYGVRPLFYYNHNDLIIVASELKMMNEHISRFYHCLKQFNCGSYMKLEEVSGKIKVTHESSYINYPFYSLIADDINMIHHNINYYLKCAVKKRCMNTDREVCCLLSGGLDSSLVCSIAQKMVDYKIKTFSIGLPNSVDIISARKAAKFLQTDHTEIIVTEEDFFNAIPEVIYNIESYDTTTVRASVGNYLVSKYISNNTDCKVVLNGDGADELCGGYLYFSACQDPFEFDKECKRLLNSISYFDVLRSDKSVSSNGLEPRTPFLDRSFVQYYLSISPILRCHSHNKKIEKYLIRDSFKDDNLLPTDILYRRKEAFSDGVSCNNKSWSTIIQERLQSLPEIKLEYDDLRLNDPSTKEQEYYLYLFEKYYKYSSNLIPYYWMPKYVNATDSSARTLSIYNVPVIEESK